MRALPFHILMDSIILPVNTLCLQHFNYSIDLRCIFTAQTHCILLYFHVFDVLSEIDKQPSM